MQTIKVMVIVKRKDEIFQLTPLILEVGPGGGIDMPLSISQVPIFNPQGVAYRCEAKFYKKGKSGVYMYEEV